MFAHLEGAYQPVTWQQIAEMSPEVLRSLGNKVNISINVDTTNIKFIPAFLEEMIEELSFGSFSYILNPVNYTAVEVPAETLFDVYFSMRKKYGNRVHINNRLITNLMNLFANRPLSWNRCNLATTYVLNFLENRIYACPQNEDTTIGIMCHGAIKMDKKGIESKISQISYD